MSLRTRKWRAGFTFLELLVGTLIFSMLAIAIYSSFSIGVRAWRRGEEDYRSRQEARYLLNTLSRELRCAVNSSLIRFSGESGSVSFCKASDGIYEVTYLYEPEQKSVYRLMRTYAESINAGAGVRSKVASGISDFKMTFAYKEGGKIVWQEFWNEENAAVPYGIKVLIEPSPGGKQYSLTILVPTGTLRDEEGL